MYIILLQPVCLQAFCTEELCNEIKAQTNTPGYGSPGWMVLLKKKNKTKGLKWTNSALSTVKVESN